MIDLHVHDATARISPVDGGRIASLNVGGRDLLVTGDSATDPLLWGCYPMVPFAGRVRNGRFTFGGQQRQLHRNLGPHAIHGTGFTSAWEILDAGFDHIELQCALDWGFGGSAHQHILLTDEALVCVLSVLAGGEAMPVTLGWHPWFVTPDEDRFEFAAMYRRDADGLPTGELIDPTPRPWDDCFVGNRPPVELVYAPSRLGGTTRWLPGLSVRVSSDCDHWVVYDEPVHATCVEPQSAPPDAFNLALANVLAPGEFIQRTMTVSWQMT